MAHSDVLRAELSGKMSSSRIRAALLSIGILIATLGIRSTALAASAECGSDDLLKGKPAVANRDVRGDAGIVTDGAIATPGADWDSSAALVLDTDSAFLTYDLGEPRLLSSFYVQADANDTYEISGSIDGTDGSYKLLLEVPSAIESGHGLRSRSLRIAPTEVRYLRIGQGNGDGFYSISEFAAFCTAPNTFEAAFRTVDSLPRTQPQPPPPPPATAPSVSQLPDQAEHGSTALFAALLLLAGIAWVYAVSRLPKRSRRDKRPATEAISPQAAGEGRRDWQLRGLFLASGAAALIYEIVWFHLLRLVIGASALSVGLVLASFMGGMFLGSLFFARFVPAGRAPLRVYAWLELGIGGFGLLMPLLLPAARLVYVGLVGYGALGIALRGLVAAVLLLPPTALMGATLPAVSRHCSSSPNGMSKLAGLYAANTIGAVLGCLLTGFYLLAEGDVWIATGVAVLLNLGIGAYALRFVSHSEPTKPTVEGEAPASNPKVRAARAILFATALSGLTAIGAQVVWTRLLTLLFGATVYAFSIILAVFLSGLGIGSALAAGWLKRGANALRALAWTQAALVPALLLGAWLLARVLPFAAPSAGIPVRALHMLHVLRAIDVMLPATILWGTSFPLALAAMAGSAEDPGKSSGQVYAANTLGAILGALAVSFAAIPAFGTRWAEQLLALIAAVSAATLFLALGRTPGEHRGQSVRAVWVLLGGVVVAVVLPGMPIAFLAHGRYLGWSDPRDQFPYVSEGAASTVAVHIAPDGYRHFHVSGRVEASNNPGDLRLERLLGHLSALALPHPESVLVVGLGGGVTAGALTLHPEIKRIVICEIEPRVVGAAQQFAHENYSVLSDPRVQLVFDDARHFLATTRERFDVITSDPIHPWVRGNSVLFSREYYAIVKSRLKPNGIATQWVPLYETSEQAIKIQMQTFLDAFPNGSVFNSSQSKRGYDVVLLGGVGQFGFDVGEMQRRIDDSPRLQQSLREVRIGSAVDLLATYGGSGPDMSQWLAGTPVNRDFSLKLEYISGLSLNETHADEIYANLSARRSYPASLLKVSADEERELRRRMLPGSDKH